MRILFFSHYFPPEVNAPANRTYEHCREWVGAGHDVHVITCLPSHPIGVPFAGYRRRWYQREQMDGMTVHRVWTYLAANAGIVKRTVCFLSFVPSAVWRGLRLGSFDIIIGTSPQFFCAAAAWLAAAFKCTPWVFELRDLWPESITAVGAARRYMPLRFLERFELAMYRSARAVVCVSQSFRHNLASRGIDPLKLHFIPNGVDAEFWKSGDRERGRAALGVGVDDVVVSYVGTIGMAHDLQTILAVATRCQTTHPRLRFVLVGDGAELGTLRKLAESEGSTNVLFTGLIPRERIPDVLAATDISLVTLKPSEVFKTVLPSKMFEAMAAAKPIVLAVDGEAKDELHRAGGGVAVPPGNPAATMAAMLTLAADAELRRGLGESAARYVEQHFSRRVWAIRYLRLLEHARLSGLAATDPARQPSTFPSRP